MEVNKTLQDVWLPPGLVLSFFILSLLRAWVQPTLDPSVETVSKSNALAQGKTGIGWCVRVCAGKES